jgi:hypothetical protein
MRVAVVVAAGSGQWLREVGVFAGVSADPLVALRPGAAGGVGGQARAAPGGRAAALHSDIRWGKAFIGAGCVFRM